MSDDGVQQWRCGAGHDFYYYPKIGRALGLSRPGGCPVVVPHERGGICTAEVSKARWASTSKGAKE